MLPELLLPLAVTLITASALLSDRLTNMLVRYELYGWQGTAFLPFAPPQNCQIPTGPLGTVSASTPGSQSTRRRLPTIW